MIKDERIRTTMQRFSAHGFILWYVMLLADLLYRQLYLHQPVSEYGDIALIFFGGCLYVSLAFLTHGAYTVSFKKQFMIIFPAVMIGLLVVRYFKGSMESLYDLLGSLLGLALSFCILFPLAYYLNRRWEKKCGPDD